jgi:hypothetical protein
MTWLVSHSSRRRLARWTAASSAHRAWAALVARDGQARIAESMFPVDGHFPKGDGHLHSVRTEEVADANVFDPACPELTEGAARFVDRCLDAGATVPVLQGPPGTGKTLGKIASARHNGARPEPSHRAGPPLSSSQ